MSSYAMTINGQQVKGAQSFPVINPATGKPLADSPKADAAQVDAAVAAARAAFPGWAATSDAERKAACHRIADVIEQNAGELARLLTQEQGKPLKGLGSEFELGGCVGWTRYTAELSLPVKVLEDSDKQRVELHRKPVGVVGSITPWNWPLMILIWHIIPAIRLGCTVVNKPSELTPLSTLRMVELISSVLPPGVLNTVAGQGDVGAMLSTHGGVDKVVFTGSIRTGKAIMKGAAESLKRLTLELGGNDAGIVLPDVNPAQIAEGLFWGAFINGGQTCAALKRLYVHDDVYDAVCAELTKVCVNMPMGDGLDEANVMGPIQNERQFNIVRELVEDAKKKGGRVLCGGEPKGGDGYFYPLTLVADVSDGVALVDQEQFGPALPIIRYSDVDEVIKRANASENGLGGSIWSSDIPRAAALAQRLECGSAWVNSHGMIAPHVPFGGVKCSGIGVEFGEEGLAEYTTVQALTVPK